MEIEEKNKKGDMLKMIDSNNAFDRRSIRTDLQQLFFENKKAVFIGVCGEGNDTAIRNNRMLIKNLYGRYELIIPEYNVYDVDEIYEDHVYVEGADLFQKAGITTGDTVQFSAEIYIYERKNGTVDYGLRNPVDIVKSEYVLTNEEKDRIDKQRFEQFVQQVKCELCLYQEQCYGICIM